MTRKYRLHFPFKAISKDNEKIFNRSGRPFLSRKYKDFEATIRSSFVRQITESLPLFPEGDLCMSLTCTFSKRVHSDAFNIPKGICDALQGLFYTNDRQIKRGSVDVNYGEKNEFWVEISGISHA